MSTLKCLRVRKTFSWKLYWWHLFLVSDTHYFSSCKFGVMPFSGVYDNSPTQVTNFAIFIYMTVLITILWWHAYLELTWNHMAFGFTSLSLGGTPLSHIEVSLLPLIVGIFLWHLWPFPGFCSAFQTIVVACFLVGAVLSQWCSTHFLFRESNCYRWFSLPYFWKRGKDKIILIVEK